MKFFSFENKREIHRIYIAHTLRRVVLSVVGIYIPIFFLTLGFSLTKIILFFVIFHFSGLLFTLTTLPYLFQKWGTMRVLKIYYPLEISFYILLYVLPFVPALFWIAAFVGGLATFIYWVPMNILLLKHSQADNMGSDLAMFFAFPKALGIAGPLIGAILIPFVGFWPVFSVAMLGLAATYLPLAGIRNSELDVSFDFRLSHVWRKLRERPFLFVLEGFDNIIEESEWFWGIFVFLIIGTLEAPGIVGSLEALGAAMFTVVVGTYANQNAKLLIPIASVGLILGWVVRIGINSALSVYIVTLATSFIMTFFLVSYVSFIYQSVKHKKEEEFLILREIPTVIGRMIVFGAILLTVNNSRFFFMLPIIAILLLLAIFWWKKPRLAM